MSKRKKSTAEKLIETAVGICLNRRTACIELFDCPNPNCRTRQWAAHPFSEVINCGACGTRCHSAAPRPIVYGEVTADHLTTAISNVASAYSPENYGDDTLKIDELPPEYQGAVQARIAASVRRALEDILVTANSMAHNPLPPTAGV